MRCWLFARSPRALPRSANLAECGIREWDVEFVDVEQEILFEIILAANYLDIKALLDLTCAKVASAGAFFRALRLRGHAIGDTRRSMIKGKTPEEIRKQFNIVNDFTPEEEAQVREENKWCEDA